MNNLFVMDFDDFEKNVTAMNLAIEKGASSENLIHEIIDILDPKEKENFNSIED